MLICEADAIREGAKSLMRADRTWLNEEPYPRGAGAKGFRLRVRIVKLRSSTSRR
jgi:hypothetical protein